MTGSWLQRLRHTIRDFLGVTPTLDLHGLRVREAIDASEQFLRQAQRAGEPIVRIVYGKGLGSPGGRGVLREVIPHWLEHAGASLIARYERQPDPSGGDGSVKVWLRPPERQQS